MSTDMEDALRRIDEILRQDLGNRGLMGVAPANPMEQLLAALENDSERVAFLTGFPVIREDGRATGETDGPAGVAHVVWALEQLGKQALVLTDIVAYAQVFAALGARGCKTTPRVVERKTIHGDSLAILMAEFEPTICVTLERPGRAADGHYHNMRGEIIDDYLIDTAGFIEIAHGLGAVTISVGDGGNELGMGTYRDLVEDHVPLGDTIVDTQTVDIALVAGVSNWWGWGMVALLSLIAGRDLLPSDDMEREMLEAVLRSGGVDGCSRERALSIDNISLDEHLKVLAGIREIVCSAIAS